MKLYELGYTTGVFDIFHIGHLNILRRAKECCQTLIVGVCTDELTLALKGAPPVMPFVDRLQIIQSIKYVDLAVAETTDDKLEAWRQYQFEVIFKGDDWQGTPKWIALEEKFRQVGVSVVFLPHTQGVNSTTLREKLLTD